MRLVGEDLKRIYRQSVYRAAPPLLLQPLIERAEIENLLHEPMSVIALGKAASSLLKGAAAAISIDRAFAALPEAYRQDEFPPYAEVVYGSHPEMSRASFDAGEALVRFVESSSRPILFLLSGGASACVAKPLEPWFSRDDLVHVNRKLLRAGLPIESINVVRKHLSAIKGGRLGQRLPRGSLCLVLSDVSRGRWLEVASGPTVPDSSTNEDAASLLDALEDRRCAEIAARLRRPEVPETVKALPEIKAFLLGDNATLLRITASVAESLGYRAIVLDAELNGDVEEAAEALYAAASDLPPGAVLVAGGEPTVRVQGTGKGGRCSEVAVRLGRRLEGDGERDLFALLGSSDGIDGVSEAAAYLIAPERYRSSTLDRERWDEALQRSDSWSIVDHYAETLESRPTGNNLRDLFLLARA